MKLFPDRHTWFTHELQNHLVEWNCCFCSHLPYQSRDNFDKHVRRSHSNKFTEDQLPALVKACQKPVDKIPASTCPFCDEWEPRLRGLNQHMSADEILVVTPQQFRHHVGSHMEQLALFAIPRGYKEDGDADSAGAAPGHGSDSSSDRSLIRAEYEDEDNPRLHVAAFEGLLDEVRASLEIIMKREPKNVEYLPHPIFREEGSTWGSGMASPSFYFAKFIVTDMRFYVQFYAQLLLVAMLILPTSFWNFPHELYKRTMLLEAKPKVGVRSTGLLQTDIWI